eukprot:gene26418-17517_t
MSVREAPGSKIVSNVPLYRSTTTSGPIVSQLSKMKAAPASLRASHFIPSMLTTEHYVYVRHSFSVQSYWSLKTMFKPKSLFKPLMRGSVEPDKGKDQSSIEKTELDLVLHHDAHEEGGLSLNDEKLAAEINKAISGWITSMGRRLLSGSLNIINSPLPVAIFEPRSYLEKLADVWVYPSYLKQAAESQDPVERLKLTVTWFIAGLHHAFDKWKKPFNPLLGETWQAAHSDGSQIFMEQISHHPPISAFHIEGPDGLYNFRGLSQPNVSILLKYYGFKTLAKGFRYVEFKDGSRIDITYPAYVMRGIVRSSSTRAEVEGSASFTYQAAGLEAVISFGATKAAKPALLKLSNAILLTVIHHSLLPAAGLKAVIRTRAIKAAKPALLASNAILLTAAGLKAVISFGAIKGAKSALLKRSDAIVGGIFAVEGSKGGRHSYTGNPATDTDKGRGSYSSGSAVLDPAAIPPATGRPVPLTAPVTCDKDDEFESASETDWELRSDDDEQTKEGVVDEEDALVYFDKDDEFGFVSEIDGELQTDEDEQTKEGVVEEGDALVHFDKDDEFGFVSETDGELWSDEDEQTKELSNATPPAASGAGKSVFGGFSKMIGLTATAVASPFSDAHETEEEMGTPLCRLEGSWLSHMTFDGEKYWELKKVCKEPWQPSAEALYSDARYRSDLSTLQSGDVKTAQSIPFTLVQDELLVVY